MGAKHRYTCVGVMHALPHLQECLKSCGTFCGTLPLLPVNQIWAAPTRWADTQWRRNRKPLLTHCKQCSHLLRCCSSLPRGPEVLLLLLLRRCWQEGQFAAT